MMLILNEPYRDKQRKITIWERQNQRVLDDAANTMSIIHQSATVFMWRIFWLMVDRDENDSLPAGEKSMIEGVQNVIFPKQKMIRHASGIPCDLCMTTYSQYEWIRPESMKSAKKRSCQAPRHINLQSSDAILDRSFIVPSAADPRYRVLYLLFQYSRTQ